MTWANYLGSSIGQSPSPQNVFGQSACPKQQAAAQWTYEGHLALYHAMRAQEWYIQQYHRTRADEVCGPVPDDIQ